MKKYQVAAEHTITRYLTVEAENEKEALEKLRQRTKWVDDTIYFVNDLGWETKPEIETHKLTYLVEGKNELEILCPNIAKANAKKALVFFYC